MGLFRLEKTRGPEGIQRAQSLLDARRSPTKLCSHFCLIRSIMKRQKPIRIVNAFCLGLFLRGVCQPEAVSRHRRPAAARGLLRGTTQYTMMQVTACDDARWTPMALQVLFRDGCITNNRMGFGVPPRAPLDEQRGGEGGISRGSTTVCL